MFNQLKYFFGFIFFSYFFFQYSLAQSPLGLGKPIGPDEIEEVSINVFPDGRGLPIGKGSALEGEKIYRTQCASCHGETGKEGPAPRLRGSLGLIAMNDLLRPLRILKYPMLALSVGAQWPYATSIFDYIRRGMPAYAPKSLTHDEVYAVTAYVLFLNEIVKKDQLMDQKSLPLIIMPAQKISINAFDLR